jgi:hypothetical protein
LEALGQASATGRRVHRGVLGLHREEYWVYTAKYSVYEHDGVREVVRGPPRTNNGPPTTTVSMCVHTYACIYRAQELPSSAMYKFLSTQCCSVRFLCCFQGACELQCAVALRVGTLFSLRVNVLCPAHLLAQGEQRWSVCVASTGRFWSHMCSREGPNHRAEKNMGRFGGCDIVPPRTVIPKSQSSFSILSTTRGRPFLGVADIVHLPLASGWLAILGEVTTGAEPSVASQQRASGSRGISSRAASSAR